MSIVVPVFNQRRDVEACIESIYNHTGDSFEVIVIDNASTDGVQDWLQTEASERRAMRVVRSEVNLGFPGGVNLGASKASGDYLAICNSDVMVTPGWLDLLRTALERNDMVGIASPVTNYIGEGPQRDVAAQGVSPGGANEFARAVRDDPSRQMFTVPDRLVFFCVLLRRVLFTQLGGLSEDFGLGNFEDDDFCVRARLAGYQLAVCPNAFVYHAGTKSWQNSNHHSYWMRRNRQVFYEKLAGYSVHRPPAFRRSHPPQPDVSVVVRTVDRPALLIEALASLANQTFRNFETIVVRDGGPSIDTVLEAVEPFLDVRSVAVDPPRGRTEALNKGLEAAQGRWITYLDDDDLVYPTHLEILTEQLRRTGARAARSLLHKVLRSTGDHPTTLARQPFGAFEFDKDALLIDNFMPVHSVIHERACLDTIGPFDTSFDVLEDWDFMIRLVAAFGILDVPKFTGEYRFRVAGSSPNAIVSRLDQRLAATQRIYSRYPTTSRKIRAGRNMTIKAMIKQSSMVADVARSALSSDEKAYLITCRIGGFDPWMDSFVSLREALAASRTLSVPTTLHERALFRSVRAVLPLLRIPVVHSAGRWLEQHNAWLGAQIRRVHARALEERALQIERTATKNG